MNKVHVGLIAVVLCAFPARVLPAATMGIDFNTADIGVAANGSSSFILGWEFATNTPISVTHLGYFDDSGNGFNASHQVGLWSAAGTLLASATVTSTDALTSRFRFAPITPVALASGGNFRVGGVATGDEFAWDPVAPVFGTALNFVSDRWLPGGVLSFPTFSGSSDPRYQGPYGWFGANVMYVPEPSALAVLCAFPILARAISRRTGIIAPQ